jgi:hypothetical protein
VVTVGTGTDVGTVVTVGTVVFGGSVVDCVPVVLDGSLRADWSPLVIWARPTPAAAAKANPTSARAIVFRGKRFRPGTGAPFARGLGATETSRHSTQKLAACSS